MSESDFRPEDPDEVRTSADPPGVESGVESPEADAAEQLRELVEPESDDPPNPAYDVDPADAAEQHRVVDFDEGDYR